MTLKRYKDWAPTAFDIKGHCSIGYDIDKMDQRDWYVAPVIRTRDSQALEVSNFEVFLRRVGGESSHVAIHRFGHWGVGWFEIVLVKPDTDAAREAELVRESLEDYGCLDEMHYSAKQAEMGEDDNG